MPLRRLIFAALLGLAMAAGACSSGLSSAEDRARLEQLRKEVGSQARFDATDIYLRMTISSDSLEAEPLARRVFDRFWMNAGKPREDSELVYLNVYHSSDQFLFQLYWNPSTQLIERAQREHY